MIYPGENEYIKKSGTFNVVPVYKKYFVDTETPATIFLKLSMEKDCGKEMFLLESVEGARRLSRYSFIGAGYSHLIEFSNGVFSIFKGSGLLESEPKSMRTDRPLSKLEQFLSEYRVYKDPELTHFLGGAVGYMSYDLVKYFENIDIPPAGTGFPEMMLYLTDCIIVFDHLLNTVNIIATVKNDSSDMDCKKAYRLSCEKIMQIENIIFKPFRHGTNHENNIRYNLMQQSHTGGNTDGILFENNGTIPQLKNLSKSIFQDAPDGIFQNSNLSLTSNFTMGSFTEAVNRAKRYINEGEVFQLVLSQRFEVGNFSGQIDAFSIYRILRNLNPSPYMYYLSFNDFKIIGSSPEPLIKVTGRKIITCPIAGTRKRGRNEGEDKKIITSLLSDDKEKAEHNMLVDLSRNDLGRVCRYGSVKVKRYMKVEKYSHVVHLVSRVEGLLKKEETIFNALKSTFPAGTLTGAPKIRAMQLISGLEPVRRGPYGGIIGYFGYDSSLDCCITIRTALAKDNKVYIQAGAGIVYDSVAENEYLETLNKAKALLYAVIRGGQNQNNYER